MIAQLKFRQTPIRNDVAGKKRISSTLSLTVVLFLLHCDTALPTVLGTTSSNGIRNTHLAERRKQKV